MWRVLVGLHESIMYSFLPVGHTKFAPDWCFGLLKQKYRHTKVNSLKEFAEVVESSATTNSVQLVGSQEGELIVRFHDWHEYLSPHFKKLEGIKKYHHFAITSSAPGVVTVSHHSSASSTDVTLLSSKSWKPTSQDMPELLTPNGLSNKRKWYLYEKIRQYCSDESKDIVCPKPDMTRELSVPPELSPPPSQSSEKQEPPMKKARLCGNCGMTGHNKRSCTN